MNNFLKFLFSKLYSVHTRVYHEVAPSIDPATKRPPVFPYIVYRLGTSLNEFDNREDFPLIINVWDNKPLDTTDLENLTDSIQSTFKNLRHLDDNFFLMFIKEGRSPVSGSDDSIRGRQLRYTVKQYER